MTAQRPCMYLARASGTHDRVAMSTPGPLAARQCRPTGTCRSETSAFASPCRPPGERQPNNTDSGTARGRPRGCGVLIRHQEALPGLADEKLEFLRSKKAPAPHHVQHIPLSFTPELGGSHSAFFAPCSSAVECHGCYRLMGPATITKLGSGNHIEAHLQEGAVLELFHPDGNVLVSRDALAQLDERYVCICIGHNVEISGQYRFLCSSGPEEALAHLHSLHLHGDKLVLSVDSLPLGTVIELAAGAVLMHPVTAVRA